MNVFRLEFQKDNNTWHILSADAFDISFILVKRNVLNNSGKYVDVSNCCKTGTCSRLMILLIYLTGT